MAEFAPAQLKAILEDTQASLAAALGRIEAFRIRERQLMAEISELRLQVHGGGEQGAEAPTSSKAGPKTATELAGTGAAGPKSAVAQLRDVPSSAGLRASLAKPQVQWTSPSSRPVYVTDFEGDYPVHIVTGTKKVPGSLVVSKDYVDFVEVKARIRQEEFVGITTVKAGTSTSGKKPGSSLFLCCAAPPETTFSGDVGDAGACKDDDSSPTGSGVWQILWNKNGMAQRLAFEASHTTRESLHQHTERWLGEVNDDQPRDSAPAADGELEICIPKNMTIGDSAVRLVGDPSQILSDDHLKALGSVVPPLERMKDWVLTYATHKHGISLQTLYRKAVHGLPTLLLVKDFGGFVFGAYTPDSWRVAPRFYGSGETFVFQLEPYRVAYPWRSMSRVKNDFFMYGTPECMAVGGLGHFAIWVDSDLLQGSSGTCGTFGSPCLAQSDEFRIQHVEMWQATN